MSVGTFERYTCLKVRCCIGIAGRYRLPFCRGSGQKVASAKIFPRRYVETPAVASATAVQVVTNSSITSCRAEAHSGVNAIHCKPSPACHEVYYASLVAVPLVLGVGIDVGIPVFVYRCFKSAVLKIIGSSVADLARPTVDAELMRRVAALEIGHVRVEAVGKGGAARLLQLVHGLLVLFEPLARIPGTRLRLRAVRARKIVKEEGLSGCCVAASGCDAKCKGHAHRPLAAVAAHGLRPQLQVLLKRCALVKPDGVRLHQRSLCTVVQPRSHQICTVVQQVFGRTARALPGEVGVDVHGLLVILVIVVGEGAHQLFLQCCTGRDCRGPDFVGVPHVSKRSPCVVRIEPVLHCTFGHGATHGRLRSAAALLVISRIARAKL